MPATAAPLELPLTPSLLGRYGWVAAHFFAAIMTLAAAATWRWAVLGWILIALSALAALRRARRMAAWQRLRLLGDELCLVSTAGEFCGRLRAAPLIGPGLLLIDWQGPHGSERLTLFSDSAAADDLRRLRVRLMAWRRRAKAPTKPR